MWNCNWGPFSQYGIIGMLINIMMMVTIIYIVILTVRSFLSRGKPNGDTNDSIEIIKHKFVRGEITEEEFQRMKEILTG